MRVLGTVALAAVISSGAVALARSTVQVFPPLGNKTEAGWQQYVFATEQRISRETSDPVRFFAMDFGASAARDRQSVVAGTLVVASMPEATEPVHGRAIDVPDAWVHHWRGAVLIPRVKVDQVIARLTSAVPPSDDVLSSKMLASDGSRLRVFLRVQRRQSLFGLPVITLVYNTEHAVTFVRQSPGRASSSSAATRIAEVDRAGSDRERELAAGDDHGFMWRWNSYWRYQDTPAGVIAECESLALSRQAPWGTRTLAGSLAASAAAESMTRALVSLRDWFASSVSTQR